MEQWLYFGHPINVYGTALEQNLLSEIDRWFPDWRVVNPGDPCHAQGYAEWKRVCGDGMEYFLKRVLPACRGGIFLPFRDGKWGQGVFREAAWFEERGLPVWAIGAGAQTAVVSPQLLERFGLVLTVEETRARIRNADGTLRPY